MAIGTGMDLAQQHASATAVQAQFKGHCARKEREQMVASATAMQAAYRAYDARSQVVGGERRQRYYAPAEISKHNRAEDLWVSVFDKVFDLTELVRAHPGPLAQPLIEAAGTDITHWFDPRTHGLRKYIDPQTNQEAPFLPMGRFIHCPNADGSVNSSPAFEGPWWADKGLHVGTLTRKTREIKLLNMLTKQETVLEVCTEETLNEIRQRYLQHNAHAASYVWKRLDGQASHVLDMHQTLKGNGIPDEDAEFDSLAIPDDYYMPTLQLYFSDDLTEA